MDQPTHNPATAISTRLGPLRVQTIGALVILPGAGHIGPLLQAAPAVVELVTAIWSDPAATIAHHRSATAPGSRSSAS